MGFGFELGALFKYVRGPGFEPGLTAPKAAVLPLDDPRMVSISKIPKIREYYYYKIILCICKAKIDFYYSCDIIK